MSVFGVDLGANNCVVAVSRRGGVDVICNEVSKRETATVVTLGEDERCIGEKGLDRAVRNPRQSVPYVKRFIGMRIDDPLLEHERKFVLCPIVADDQGKVMFELTYNGESQNFYPEQILAMIFTQLRSYAETEAMFQAKSTTHIDVTDCVVSVPPYYNTEQRKLVIQAAELAGLNPMSLISENAAAALDYGIFKNSTLPEEGKEGLVIAIVDVGNSCTTVSIVELWKGSMKVLSQVWDVRSGTRDIDGLLLDYFIDEIQKKYKMDVRENKKALLRLRNACDKCKIMLSANLLAPLNVENLMNDTDVAFPTFERKDMEAWIVPMVERINGLCKEAVTRANVDLNRVSSVELIGGGGRIPVIKATVSEAFGKPCSFTLNASETVSRGCAITAAVFSPKFQVREFVVNEYVSFPIGLAYRHPKPTKTSTPPPFLPASINKTMTILGKNQNFPKVVELTFEISEDMELFFYYEDCEELKDKANHNDRIIGRYSIQGVKPNATGIRIRVKFAASGLVILEAAHALYEEVVPATPPAEGAEKKEGEATPPPAEEKKKITKSELTVHSIINVGLLPDFFVAAKKREAEMHHQDRQIFRTREAKNGLESYIYDNRGRVGEGGIYSQFVTQEDQDKFGTLCNSTEEWLYGDGENATIEQYHDKLATLKQIGEAGARRYRFHDDLPSTIRDVEQRLTAHKESLTRLLGTDTHITADELKDGIAKVDDAVKWMQNQKAEYEGQQRTQDSKFTLQDLNSKADTVGVEVKKVLNKPKPKPATPSPPPANANATASPPPAAAAETDASNTSPKPQEGPAAPTEVD